MKMNLLIGAIIISSMAFIVIAENKARKSEELSISILELYCRTESLIFAINCEDPTLSILRENILENPGVCEDFY
jgi:hypothetical protein